MSERRFPKKQTYQHSSWYGEAPGILQGVFSEKTFQSNILLDVKADLYTFTYITKLNLG